ncbi:hypothetical protein [Scytonema sp. UIC 10036]|uniref:hypothetical protein n=1 Tax=Scytonema sp. UIC 10036 TaxID=2304196 RepID=UPI00140FB9E9|nr:hypothetical protein [Scytonema sp. UIC 10036]
MTNASRALHRSATLSPSGISVMATLNLTSVCARAFFNLLGLISHLCQVCHWRIAQTTIVKDKDNPLLISPQRFSTQTSQKLRN